eukprot:UC1_evm1s1930
MALIETEVTRMFKIKHPIILAGMNVAAGPALAAAVTNAGGLGVIGGVGYTPAFLRKQLDFLKADLVDKNAPFGVDLLLPKVGGGARKTNTDYTNGTLPELIDIIIEAGASLFVSAVGIPPKWAVDKLHAAGIPVMNMVGSPRHVAKCLAVGVDLVCAQGGEGGGHTGEVATSILVPAVVDLCRGKRSPLTGQPVQVIAAGGIFDGRGLAMALAMGAGAVWVGTRFVASVEAGAPKRHKQGVVEAGVHDTMRTIWEEERSEELARLISQGIVPVKKDTEDPDPEQAARAAKLTPKERLEIMPLLSGQVAGVIDKVLPAKDIVDNMMREATDSIGRINRM